LGFFSGGLPTEPCALGSTQLLKMSTRNSPGGEGSRCVELTTNHPSRAERQEIRGLNLPGPPRAPGGPFTFTFCSVTLLTASITFMEHKKHKQWNLGSRIVTRNVRKPKLCVLSESYTTTDALPPILPACRQLLLLACVFVTRDVFCSENFFVNRFIREPRFHCIPLQH
jgi:hypothetical protein